MPDRIIRPGILTSDPVNRLSFAGEVFYRRLMSIADDYGRYDGRPTILRAMLYPLQLDKVTEPDIAKWRLETAKAGLVRVYSVENKEFIEIVKFDQRLRAATSKWPPPPTSAGGCMQARADASESEAETETESISPLPPKGENVFEEFWAAYPKKVGKGAAEQMWKRHVKVSVHDRIFASIARHKGSEQWRKDAGQFIPNPATWINQHRWEDEPQNNYAPPRVTSPVSGAGKRAPEWMAAIEEIKRLLAQPGADMDLLRKLGQTLPASAWSMLSIDEKNELNQILKGKK
jgi:hypothetical protein